MGKFLTKKDRDRLEIVNSIIFALNALNRSIHGWESWVQSLHFMSKFTEEELGEIEKSLMKLVYTFIEYDIEVTKKYMDKIPNIIISQKRRKKRDESERMYV